MASDTCEVYLLEYLLTGWPDSVLTGDLISFSLILEIFRWLMFILYLRDRVAAVSG